MPSSIQWRLVYVPALSLSTVTPSLRENFIPKAFQYKSTVNYEFEFCEMEKKSGGLKNYFFLSLNSKNEKSNRHFFFFFFCYSLLWFLFFVVFIYFYMVQNLSCCLIDIVMQNIEHDVRVILLISECFIRNAMQLKIM